MLGIENGIMDEPMADIETDANEWETYSTWPDAAAEPVEIRLGPADGELPGTLTLDPVEGEQTQTYTDNPLQREREMVEDEFTAKENRLIFLSPELENAVRFSGTPEINLRASVDAESTHFTVLIVDYGEDVRVNSRDREKESAPLRKRTVGEKVRKETMVVTGKRKSQRMKHLMKL